MSIKTVTHFYANETIAQRESDGYVCLTDMANAAGKQVSGYLRSKLHKSYVAALSADLQICTSELVLISKGGNDKLNQGTWAHLEVGMHLAQWASPEFAVWANRALREIMFTPKLSPAQEMVPAAKVDELGDKFAHFESVIVPKAMAFDAILHVVGDLSTSVCGIRPFLKEAVNNPESLYPGGKKMTMGEMLENVGTKEQSKDLILRRKFGKNLAEIVTVTGNNKPEKAGNKNLYDSSHLPHARQALLRAMNEMIDGSEPETPAQLSAHQKHCLARAKYWASMGNDLKAEVWNKKLFS